MVKSYKKRYDKINGAWTPVKKRYDKVNGSWVPSYAGYDCRGHNFPDHSSGGDLPGICADGSCRGWWWANSIDKCFELDFDTPTTITAGYTVATINAYNQTGDRCFHFCCYTTDLTHELGNNYINPTDSKAMTFIYEGQSPLTINSIVICVSYYDCGTTDWQELYVSAGGMTVFGKQIKQIQIY